MAENLVNVIDPDTQEVGSIPASQLQNVLSQGYTQATSEQAQDYIDQQKYNTIGQQIKAGLESAASAATLGGSAAIERWLGVNPEDILKREKYNPGIATAGQVVGLAASNFVPGLGEFADAEAAFKGAKTAANVARDAMKAGQITEEAAAPIFAAEQSAKGAAAHAINPLSAQSIMSGAGERAATALGLENPTSRGALKAATEMGILQSGNEISHMFENDPDQTLGSAVTDIGLASLIGAPIGGATGKLGELLENSKIGQNISKGIEDFKARMKEHLNIPDPAKAVFEELDPYTQINEEGLDVYGQNGLKAKAIEHLMPKTVNEGMMSQAENLTAKARAFSKNMEMNPDLFPRYSSAGFNRDLRVLSDSLAKPEAPEEIFNAIQDFKQRLDDLLPKKGEIPGPADREFIRSARDMRSVFKSALEDQEVWGKAAKVQSDINKAFSEYLPSLKDFKSKFMTKIGGEHALDPGKIQTYINQTGKAGQEIKKQMLGNFIEASEKFRSAVNDTYAKIGSDKSIAPGALSFTKSTLNELSPGARMADTFVKKGLAKLGGETLGTAAGAGVGHMFGAGWIGALIGEHALGPFLTSILPGLTKPLLEKEASAGGFHSAVKLGKSVLNGENIINRGVKNVFKAGSEVLPTHLIPSEKEKKSLDKTITAYRDNPEKIMDLGGPLNHYMPGHNTAIGSYAANSTQYLSSLKPNPQKMSPLDSEPAVSAAEKARYDLALTIAQQPMVALKMLKEGTLTTQAVQDLANLHPALKQRLDKMLMNEVINMEHKEDKIPYGRRMNLSLFLGQPLDSTMTPMGIQNTQSSFAMGPTPSQQQKMPKATPGGMDKMAMAEATPGQARERSRLK